MRRTVIFSLSIALLACAGAARAQNVMFKTQVVQAGPGTDQAPQVDIQRALEGLRIELKTATSGMLGEVVTGAPYAAVTTNESVQTLTDGNRIAHKSSFNVYRDGQGRVRREELNDNGVVTSVMIMDPVAGTSYVLDPATRTARKMALLWDKNVVVMGAKVQKDEAGSVSSAGGVYSTSTTSAPPHVNTFEFKAPAPPGGGGVYAFGDATFVTTFTAKMEFHTEALGTQMMEGVMADGTKSVSTIPAGQIGNERPIDIVSEQWYSKDLKMTVMSRNADPRSGDTTYRVTNIRRGEPDAALFTVPADYTIK